MSPRNFNYIRDAPKVRLNGDSFGATVLPTYVFCRSHAAPFSASLNENLLLSKYRLVTAFLCNSLLSPLYHRRDTYLSEENRNKRRRSACRSLGYKTMPPSAYKRAVLYSSRSPECLNHILFIAGNKQKTDSPFPPCRSPLRTPSRLPRRSSAVSHF